MSDLDRSTCRTLSHFLHAAGRIGPFGWLLSAATLWLASRAPHPMAWIVAALALGGFERLVALRVDFDARLFGAMADARLPDLSTLDHALGALGWRRGGLPRPLDVRVRGARALVTRHAAVIAVQCALLALLVGQP